MSSVTFSKCCCAAQRMAYPRISLMRDNVIPALPAAILSASSSLKASAGLFSLRCFRNRKRSSLFGRSTRIFLSKRRSNAESSENLSLPSTSKFVAASTKTWLSPVVLNPLISVNSAFSISARLLLSPALCRFLPMASISSINKIVGAYLRAVLKSA